MNTEPLVLALLIGLLTVVPAAQAAGQTQERVEIVDPDVSVYHPKVDYCVHTNQSCPESATVYALVEVHNVHACVALLPDGTDWFTLC